MLEMLSTLKAQHQDRHGIFHSEGKALNKACLPHTASIDKDAYTFRSNYENCLVIGAHQTYNGVECQ